MRFAMRYQNCAALQSQIRRLQKQTANTQLSFWPICLFAANLFYDSVGKFDL